MGSSLRHTKSEENLTGGEPSDKTNVPSEETQQSSPVAKQTPVKTSYTRNPEVSFNFIDDDPNDCWSQEDDEITQQVIYSYIFSYIRIIHFFVHQNFV
jgi:Tfp pilus assembly protein PilW